MNGSSTSSSSEPGLSGSQTMTATTTTTTIRTTITTATTTRPPAYSVDSVYVGCRATGDGQAIDWDAEVEVEVKTCADSPRMVHSMTDFANCAGATYLDRCPFTCEQGYKGGGHFVCGTDGVFEGGFENERTRVRGLLQRLEANGTNATNGSNA